MNWHLALISNDRHAKVYVLYVWTFFNFYEKSLVVNWYIQKYVTQSWLNGIVPVKHSFYFLRIETIVFILFWFCDFKHRCTKWNCATLISNQDWLPLISKCSCLHLLCKCFFWIHFFKFLDHFVTKYCKCLWSYKPGTNSSAQTY